MPAFTFGGFAAEGERGERWAGGVCSGKRNEPPDKPGPFTTGTIPRASLSLHVQMRNFLAGASG